MEQKNKSRKHLSPLSPENRRAAEQKRTSAVMGALSRQYPDAQRMKQGMRLDLEDGSVWIAPANDREALRVVTEGARAETALELCDFITNEAGKWDAL